MAACSQCGKQVPKAKPGAVLCGKCLQEALAECRAEGLTEVQMWRRIRERLAARKA